MAHTCYKMDALRRLFALFDCLHRLIHPSIADSIADGHRLCHLKHMIRHRLMAGIKIFVRIIEGIKRGKRDHFFFQKGHNGVLIGSKDQRLCIAKRSFSFFGEVAFIACAQCDNGE